MKLNIRTLLPGFVCGAIISTSCVLLAEDAAPATSGTTTSGTSAPGAGGKGDHHRGEEMFQHLVQQLNLTPEQQEKIKPILEDMHQKMMALHGDASLGEDQKREKMKQIREDSVQQMKQFLTPDQIAKLGEMREHHHNGGQPGASPGQSGTNSAQ